MWWSYLNYNKQFYEGMRVMVCFPLRDYESNSVKTFRRHLVAKSESYHFESQLPMPAETYGGVQICPTNSQAQLRMDYDGVMDNEKTKYAWVPWTVLTSQDFTQNNLWWGRLAEQGDACAVFWQNY